MKIKHSGRGRLVSILQKMLVGSRRLWAGLLSLSLIGLLSACQPMAGPVTETVEYQISRASSGQAIEGRMASSADPSNQQIRLLGISAPDQGQAPWGAAAKAYLHELLVGQQVLLEFDQQQQDSYGRKLAYIWQDGKLVNAALVREGYVLAQSWPPNSRYDAVLQEAQDTARLLGLGIWNPDRPMRQSPGDFRQQQARL